MAVKLRLAAFGTSELALVFASRRGQVTIIKNCNLLIQFVTVPDTINFIVNVKEYDLK